MDNWTIHDALRYEATMNRQWQEREHQKHRMSQSPYLLERARSWGWTEGGPLAWDDPTHPVSLDLERLQRLDALLRAIMPMIERSGSQSVTTVEPDPVMIPVHEVLKDLVGWDR